MYANRIACLSILLAALFVSGSASGLGLFNPAPGPWSLAREKGCAAGNIADCYLWLLDPPSTISEIFVEIAYDPVKMSIIETGFLCSFAEPGTGSCPTTAPGTTGIGTSTLLGDPLAGSVADLVLGPGTLSLKYTLPAGAGLGGADQNFFGIRFTSPFGGVTFFDKPGSYDFMQVRTSCTTDDPQVSCGSSNPVYGANFHRVPVGSTFALMGIGCLAASAARGRRGRH